MSDYVKFNTKIKSVTCIQPEIIIIIMDLKYANYFKFEEIMKGNLKVCLTLIFKVNYGGQVTYISHIEIPNIGYVQIDTNIESLSHIQPMMDKGHNK